MKYILIILIFFPVLLCAQTETERWSKADISYQVKSHNTDRNYGIEDGPLTDIFISSLTTCLLDIHLRC